MEKSKPNKWAKALFSLAAIIFVVAFCYISHLPLILPLLLIFAGIHLSYFKKADARLFLQLGLLLTLVIFTIYYMTKYYANISPYYFPVASVAMLVILLYNDVQLSFMMALLCSVFVGLIAGNDFSLMLIMFLGSLLAVYYIKDARTRGHLIRAGLFVGGIQALTAILLYPGILSRSGIIIFTDRPLFNSFLWFMDVAQHVKPFIFNGIISAFVVMATSKLFETLFGVLTNFSLLELADFNQPLLRKLVLEAPGTYHHSLVVSSIAEAAADAVGANALLTRVGAYYHDIGKTIKPEYFTENQTFDGKSKHDTLEPSMSKLVILNHVKEGVELAKEYKLNQKIIDFIPQHHGTGLIFYFYQRALEDSPEGQVEESTFRYPGPKPQSRETAIVLLADSVEGAVRAMDEPTPSRIDEVVRKVVNNKFIDGQLDECELTLKNLESICATFTRVLSAMYHGRIKYPEKKNGNGNHSRKSPEGDSLKAKAPHSPGKENPPS